jgi:hypothetical protein
MLIVQMVMALFLALSAGEAPMVASLGANPVSIGEEQLDYQREPKDADPEPVNVTLSELKAMYN